MNWSSDCLMSYLVNVLRGRERGLLATLLKYFLLPASWIYQFVIFFRNIAFDRGWLKQEKVSAHVISVGNLVSGGSGKTPVTLSLARDLATSKQVAVLSRGYRSKAEKAEVLRIDGQSVAYGEADRVGDEPLLLAKNLLGVLVYVGSDRCQSARAAIADGAEVLLLDDGMQHRWLARDEEVVVIDAREPWGNGSLLPAGILREPLSSLERATRIVLTHVQSDEQVAELIQEIRKYSAAPVMSTQIEVEGVFDLEGNRVESSSGHIACFSTIAKPERLRETAESLGFTIVDHLVLPDHSSIEFATLQQFSERMAGAGATILVCTEKDRAKLGSEFSQEILPIHWVKLALVERSQGINS